MRRDSYLKIGLELFGVIGLMAFVAWFGLPQPSAKVAPKIPTVAAPVTLPKPVVVSAPVKPEPILDLKAVAEADERVNAAKNERIRAEGRAAEAAERLKSATAASASAAVAHRTLASSVRDARPRITAALAQGETLKRERAKIESELRALNAAERPRRKALVDKSPVAKPPAGDEYHFEVRRERVAFIDLERLLDKVKSDARMQIRMSNGIRPVSGVAGPVGAFSLRYEVMRLDDGSDPRMGNFGLSGWEIVPDQDVRGETFDQISAPSSEFSRAINRLNPGRDVVTLWVYPEGFPLYRQIRDMLHAKGFYVAARPLPESMPIRGSPSGSASSAQ